MLKALTSVEGFDLIADGSHSFADGSDSFADGSDSFADGSHAFADLDVPPLLEESIARHRRHVAELVRTMKTAGISDQQIEESVSVLIDLYKAELIAAIRRMKSGTW